MCLSVYKGTKWKFVLFPKTVYKIVRLGNTNKTVESLILGFKYKLNKVYKIPISEIKSSAISGPACISYSIGFHYYFSKNIAIYHNDVYYPNGTIVKCKIPAFSWYLTDNQRCGISNKIKIIKTIK